MKKSELRERERLLRRRHMLTQIERQRLGVLDRKWEIYIGKSVHAGKAVVFLSLVLMFVGGCHCAECRGIQKEQKRWGAPFVVPRPEGVREIWIVPVESGEIEGPVA